MSDRYADDGHVSYGGSVRVLNFVGGCNRVPGRVRTSLVSRNEVCDAMLKVHGAH